MPNLRDLGGHVTPDGRVRTGVLYRSVSLANLADDDVDAFAELGVVSVFDLRTVAERTEDPNRRLPGITIFDLDVLADADDAGPAHLRAVLSDPKEAEAYLGDGQAVQRFVDGYREFVTLPSARAAYRSFFTAIADDAQRPALFHCTAGKDRTGWAAATLLLLLGVGDDDVMSDYLRTNEDLAPMYAPALERFASIGGDPALLRTLAGVQCEYLDAGLDEMRKHHGTIEAYFADGLGIDDDHQRRLRDQLTESA